MRSVVATGVVMLLSTGCTEGLYPTLVPPEPIVVRALFPDAGKLTAWVARVEPRQALWLEEGLPCEPVSDAGADDCMPSGLLRLVEFPELAGCDGIEFVDALDHLKWLCVSRRGVVSAVSLGMRDGVGLADLVVDGRFPENYVVAKRDGKEVQRSKASVFWDAQVQLLDGGPRILDTANTLYLATTPLALDERLTVAADDIAVAGSFLAPTDPDCGGGACILTANNVRRIWLELSATNPAELMGTIRNAIYASNVELAQIRHTRLDSFGSGINFNTGHLLRFEDVRISNTLAYGIQLTGATRGANLQRVSVDNVGGSSEGTSALLLDGDARQIVISQARATNNAWYGILFFAGARFATISHSSVFGARFAAISIPSSNDVTIARSAMAGFNRAGIQVSDCARITLADIVAVNGDDYGLRSTRSTGSLIGTGTFAADLADCFMVDSAFVGLSTDEGACVGTEGQTVTRGDASSTFVGPAGASVSCSEVNSWIDEASPRTAWSLGEFPASSMRLPCRASNADPCSCLPYDWSVRSGDVLLRDVNAPPSGAPCSEFESWLSPIEDGRDEVFLVQAIEINDDGYGDDDGLCEEKEHCVVSDHIGDYQSPAIGRTSCDVLVPDFGQATLHFRDNGTTR